MRKYLFPILFLAFWSCEEEVAEKPKDENEPTPVSISYFQDSVNNDVIQWSMNNDIDFFRYILYGSNDKSMANKKIIYETQTRTDTNYVLESDEFYNSYRVDVLNLNESFSYSNVLNNVFVELWGEYYRNKYTTELHLGNSQLTGSIPQEIGNLTNLTDLNLGYNQLTGSIPPEIGNLTNLTYLGLSNNDFTGSIPLEIGNLINLIYLYLSENQLTGSIPSEIGNLTNLDIFWLNDNQLTGEIPSEIGNLTNLSWFTLRNNQLSGIIPDEICNVSGGSVSIYNNQLCPPYPTCIEQYVGDQDTSNCD